MKFKMFVATALALCTTIASAADEYKSMCSMRNLKENFSAIAIKWQEESVCQDFIKDAAAVASLSDSVRANYPPSAYMLVFSLDEVVGNRKVAADMAIRRISDNKVTKQFISLLSSADDPFDSENRAANKIVALSRSIELINKACASDKGCDLFSSDGAFLHERMPSKMAVFYDIKCTYRILDHDLDVLHSDDHGENICGPVFDKTRDIGLISDEILVKYKPSDYVLTFIMDQVNGGKAVAATLYLKRKVDGKATKQFAIMFESGDGPWDMHTQGLNSIIALGQAVNYMGHTCEDDPKCDLFNANVSLMRRTIRSKQN